MKKHDRIITASGAGATLDGLHPRLAAAMAWNEAKAAEYGYAGPKPRANPRPKKTAAHSNADDPTRVEESESAARIGSLRRLPKVWA